MNKCEFLDARFRNIIVARCQNNGIEINQDDFYPFELIYKFLCPKHIKTVKLWVKNHN